MSNVDQPPAPKQPGSMAGLQLVSEENGASALEPGAILAGRYRVVSLLNRSARGLVYEADDVTQHRRLALWQVTDELVKDEPARRVFSDSIQTISRIVHPNLAAVYGLVESDGRIFVSTEFVGGGTAADKLTLLGRLPWRDATRIVAEACRGIAAAQASALVHGDLSPSNILVGHDGQVKVSSFALANFLDGESRLERDPRADVFLLAVTYFTLLTGRSPCGDFESAKRVASVGHDMPIPNVRNGIPTIPLRCDTIIRRALAHDPAERYPKATSMLRDLDAALAVDDSVAPIPPPNILLPPRPSGWKRFAVWIAAGVALAMLLGLGYLVVNPWNADMKSASAKTKPLPVKGLPTVTNSIGMVLARVPAGNFIMGDLLIPDARPRHLVRINSDFLIGVFEVSQEQYRSLTGANPSAIQGDRQPVERVTWAEAVSFCESLSSLDAEKAAGRIYRLPTEAEWEYCCRAETDSPCAFGARLSIAQANFLEGGLSGTTPVGTYAPNRWGLYDMHGNVGEWCADWYGPDYYDRSPPIDPTGPTDGRQRVVRGGSWDLTGVDCLSGSRQDKVLPEMRSPAVGFRVVCQEIKEPK